MAKNLDIIVDKAEQFANRAFVPNTTSWKKAYNSKFAELLVLDMEVVAKSGTWYYDAPSCGWRNPINFVCESLKEHFGV